MSDMDIYVGPNTLKHFSKKYLGDPDNIKSLGDGTVTGAIKALMTRVTGAENSIETLNDSLGNVSRDLKSVSDKINNVETGLDSKFGIHAAYVSNCLEQTANPGHYIYNDSAANKPEPGCGGCIFTIGFYDAYAARICITTFNNLFISIYQPGISYGSWKKIG